MEVKTVEENAFVGITYFLTSLILAVLTFQNLVSRIFLNNML